jgi:hypothetical protein
VPLLVLVLLGGAAAGFYLYDRTQADRIVAGVSVGGVDVGEMSAGEARRTLARQLLPRYRRPLVFVFRVRRFRLDPAAVQLRVDITGAVATAVAASRHGGLFHRVWREVRGAPLRLRLAPRVRYSSAAVQAFVRRLSRAVDVRPRKARFVPSLVHPRISPSRNGLALRSRLLAASIRSRVLNRSSQRMLKLPTRVLVPKPTTQALERSYRYFISISRGERRLRLFEHLRLVKTYVIAVGRVGLETPAGLYRIGDKQVNPSWHVPQSAWAGSLAGKVIPPGPDDPLKARWMGFYDGAGIHGTDDLSSLGTAASHGCIRMSIPDVIQLYAIVPLDTPVFIS